MRGGCWGPARALLLAAALAASPREASAGSLGFLLVSQPRHQRISWTKLPQGGPQAGPPLRLQTLIEGDRLMHPQGIAVDQKHKRLVVADPDNMTIYSYQLLVEGGTLRAETPPDIVVHGLESRWVAVDAASNVFISDEPENQIWKIPWTPPEYRSGQDSDEPRVLYYGMNVPQVNSPGGVAADNLHVYWVNKKFGLQTGVLIRASESPQPEPHEADSVVVLGQNAQKSYGVCLGLNNVFYTDAHNNVYGVKMTGGEAKVITSKLSKPRGCVWDRDGAMYVADREGAIYSFPGNMVVLNQVEPVKVLDLEDAFGLTFLADVASDRSRSFLDW